MVAPKLTRAATEVVTRTATSVRDCLLAVVFVSAHRCKGFGTALCDHSREMAPTDAQDLNHN